MIRSIGIPFKPLPTYTKLQNYRMHPCGKIIEAEYKSLKSLGLFLDRVDKSSWMERAMWNCPSIARSKLFTMMITLALFYQSVLMKLFAQPTRVYSRHLLCIITLVHCIVASNGNGFTSGLFFAAFRTFHCHIMFMLYYEREIFTGNAITISSNSNETHLAVSVTNEMIPICSYEVPCVACLNMEKTAVVFFLRRQPLDGRHIWKASLICT